MPQLPRFGMSFTAEDEQALATEALATAVRGATRTALMNFLSVALVAAMAWAVGRPWLAAALFLISGAAALWRATFRLRLYPRGPRAKSLPRIRSELALNAALSGSTWVIASIMLLPYLPEPMVAAYLLLLGTALCTAAMHLSAIRAVAETYITVQLLSLAPFFLGFLITPEVALLGVLSLGLAGYGLITAARHLARGLLITAGRLARGHAARRLLARRRHAVVRRRADRALLESAQARALFVAKVSHDLRTPLQIIASGTEVLELRAAEAAPAAGLIDAARRIASASDRLIELAGELTDFTRWSSGNVPIRLATVDLVPLARRLTEDLAQRAQSKGLSLAVTGDPSAFVVVDPTRLRTILINLLSNSIKYSQVGPVVVDAVRVSPDRVRLSVRDRGPGLPAVVLEQLGRPWVTAESPIPGEGFGLGLFIVYSLAVELDLSMQVTSDPSGTTFSFEFAQAEPGAASVPPLGK